MFGQSADRTKGDAGRSADRAPGGIPTPTAVQVEEQVEEQVGEQVDEQVDEQVEEVDAATLVDQADAPKAILDISDSEPWNERTMGNPVQAAAAPNGRVSVLVHFDPQTDRFNRPGARAFAANQGAHVKYEYDILPNVINIRELPQGAVAALARLPGVVKVEEDREVHTMIMDAIPLIRGLQTQITAAGLSATGAGVRVCVIDTGIDSNALMYSTRIDAAAGWDFVNNDSNPEDDNGHGSHCAGTVLGGTNVSTSSCLGTQNAQGVAPQATLIGIKVLDASGSGTFSNVIAGINRCASTTLPGGQADVISMSLGGGQFAGTCDTDTAAQAANNAVTAGVVVVAAAGNDGFTNATGTPACGSKVIAVAATYDKNYPNCDFPSQTSFNWGICTDNSPVVDQRCCFSNRSSKIDVAAPGCIIFSDDSTVAAGNGLIGFCGTSQATPHVAGLAALILSENPTLTPAQVQGYIRSGAIDKGAAGFDTSYGYGRIDVINSLNLAKPAPTCTTPAQCDDANACTVDTCVSGTCVHTPINCNDSNACTTDSCSGGVCSHTAITCNDGVSCTTDTCNPATGCVFTWPACGLNDGCCGPTCTSATDPNCCLPKNASCTSNSQCCSNSCRSRRCR
jgi:subtilisin family serine protease